MPTHSEIPIFPSKAISTDDDAVVIEPYRGSNAELQAFVESTWTAAYRGLISYPLWSTEYFDWQLDSSTEADRRLCARHNGRLVAVLMGAGTRFRTPTRSFFGAHYSWLSVASEFRGMRLAQRLDEARIHLEKSVGSELIVSYRFTGSRHSLAERPTPHKPKFHQRIGLWGRQLQGSRLKKWNLNKVEGLLGFAGMPLLPRIDWPSRSPHVRLFEQIDLGQCLNIVERSADQFALTIDWDESSLQQQLAGSPITQTVVWERQGTVQGFVNFHILPFRAGTLEPVGIIDMIEVREMTLRDQSALLKSCLGLMRSQGAVVALKLRCGDVSNLLMLRTGFTPRLKDSHLVLQSPEQSVQIPRRSPMQLLWR